MRPLTRVMSIVLLGLAACLDGTTEPKTSGGSGLSLTILPGPGGVTALDSGRVVVQGPTNKTVKVTPGTTVTIDQLLPGTYTVTLQGFQGGGVAYFGQTSGVTVVVGQNTSATVTFASFRPTIMSLPAYTTDGQFVLVYSKVAAAASYVVQRSADAAFTSPTETPVAATDTSVALSIPLTGPFHMRVLAVDPLGARGLASIEQVTTTLTSVTVSPGAGSIAAGATQQFTAVAKDAQNNTIPGITFFWASSNQNVALVDQTGLATGVGGGTATISALGLGVPGGATLAVTATVPTQLAFTIQPSNAVAGDALSPALQVEVRDAGGTSVAGARDPVTLAFAANPGSGTLAGTKTVNAVNGVATFSGLSVNKVATGYTLAASSGSLGGATSAAFDVTPAAAAMLAFTTQPVNSSAGAAFTAVVNIQDRFGNTATGATDQVSVALSANAGGGTLSGTATQTAVAGVASFGPLNITKAAASYTLVASSGALAGATSASFNITAAAADRLAFVVPPPSGVEPQAVIAPSIQVAIQDAFGNTVTGATDAVTIAIGVNPGSATLSGTATQSAVSGVATFNNLGISASGNGYTLGATATSLTAASSASFDVFLEFVQIGIANFHACGLTTTGAAYCWGVGTSGQRGDGTSTFQINTPVRVGGGHQFTSISVGANHNCAIRASDGRVLCWGSAGNGRLGNGLTTPNALLPVLTTNTSAFSSVSAGGNHTCGVRTSDGRVLCWGFAGNGRLGNGVTTPDALDPVLTTNTSAFASVSAGGSHTCGVRASDGRVLCWGFGGNGRLGNGLTTDALDPVLTSNTSAFASVRAGDHTCGVRSDGFAFCWGAGANGRLGNNDAIGTDQPAPVQVTGLLRFAQVSPGSNHTCGITLGGDGFCWGAGGSGQLGNGTTGPDALVPVAVLGAHHYVWIGSGTNGASCGAATDAALCWGFNGNGQLGNGTTAQTSTPAPVTGSR